jgi:peptide/nickel transport system permease protein
MVSYYWKRIAQSVFTLWVATTLAFVLVRMLPGGPEAYIRSQLVASGEQMPPDQIAALVEAYMAYRPDDPVWIQYRDFMENLLLEGSLGQSLWYTRPVMDIMLQALPWTLYYSAISLVLGFTIRVILGAAMAYREGSKFDYGVTISGFFLGSIPYYVVALLTVIFFGFQLGWFPTSGHYDYQSVDPGLNLAFYLSVAYHSVLLIFAWVPGWLGGALGMRANSIRILGEDYLRVARLRGLREKRIASRYVARNAVLPMYTSLMIRIGSLFGGSIILEEIFSYPGLGFYTFQALQARDFPLLIGGFLFTTTATLFGITLADFTYGLVDPRAGGEDRETY